MGKIHYSTSGLLGFQIIIRQKNRTFLHLETFISHTWFAFPCGGKLVFIDVFLSYPDHCRNDHNDNDDDNDADGQGM